MKKIPFKIFSKQRFWTKNKNKLIKIMYRDVERGFVIAEIIGVKLVPADEFTMSWAAQIYIVDIDLETSISFRFMNRIISTLKMLDKAETIIYRLTKEVEDD